MATFDCERAEVYPATLDLVKECAAIRGQLPADCTELGTRLERAAIAVVINVAKGGGELPGADKARFFRRARRSAVECAAVLDILRTLGMPDRLRIEDGKSRLRAIVGFLIAMGEWADDCTPVARLQ